MSRVAKRWLVGLLLLVVAGGTLAAAPWRGADPMTVDVELARAHNLFPGSKVQILGVTVGRVLDVRAPAGEDSAIATLELRPGTDLPADVGAEVVQSSLLGERLVQLDPPYTGGPTFPDGGRIGREDTQVPAEFDELLSSLDRFLSALPPEELDRFVRNAAETLEGRGARIGEVLDTASGAVASLRSSDQELVGLLTGLADLTQTLGTRDAELRSLLTDYAELSQALAAERDGIDVALGSTAQLTVELADLLRDHGERLGASAEVVTRLTRTLDRNSTELRRLIHGQSELYRHAERVFDLEKNWLPLINHTSDLPRVAVDRLASRLAGLCERGGLAECSAPDFWSSELPIGLCLEGLIACELPTAQDEELTPLPEALDDALERVPELEEVLEDTADDAEAPAPGLVRRLLDGVLGRGR